MTKMELARRNLNLTQYEVSIDCRIHQTFISLMELGKGVPDQQQRIRLAHRLGLYPAVFALASDQIEVLTESRPLTLLRFY
jgi:transcriptional regulator with XRE-family HTH domain